MSYQKNPMAIVVILCAIFGVFIFFKRRGTTNGSTRTGFLSGRIPPQNDQMSDLFKLMLLTQTLNSNSADDLYFLNSEDLEQENQIDKVKKEILELLDE